MKQTPVLFDNIFEGLNALLNQKKYTPIFLLVDNHTHENCLPLFLPEIEEDLQIEIIEIPAGETNKTIEIAIQVWETLSDLHATRSSLMINLGGGMITDIGGFISSTYKRGIDFINIPTSLLSMVDASVGGKTGIDLNGIKNIIGTFSLPILTLIHPDFLATLPERELKSGLAEMLKHGLIYDRSHWNNLTQLNHYTSENISEFIEDSVNIKKEVVLNDPYESGLRKILNFGHTIGHAIESEYLGTDKELLHGEAIAIGMLVEAILSFENELLTKDELEEIFFHITKIYITYKIDEEKISHLLEWMKHDKKNEDDQISFSLLNGIGKCKYGILLTEKQISEGLIKYNKKIGAY